MHACMPSTTTQAGQAPPDRSQLETQTANVCYLKLLSGRNATAELLDKLIKEYKEESRIRSLSKTANSCSRRVHGIQM